MATKFEDFDDDYYDAEVIVSRWGCAVFTAKDLGMLLGSDTPDRGRMRVSAMLTRGQLPRADIKGTRGGTVGLSGGGKNQTPDQWSKRQVVGIVAERLRNGGRVVVLAP